MMPSMLPPTPALMSPRELPTCNNTRSSSSFNIHQTSCAIDFADDKAHTTALTEIARRRLARMARRIALSIQGCQSVGLSRLSVPTYFWLAMTPSPHPHPTHSINTAPGVGNATASGLQISEGTQLFSRWLGEPMRTDIPHICTRRSARPFRAVQPVVYQGQRPSTLVVASTSTRAFRLLGYQTVKPLRVDLHYKPPVPEPPPMPRSTWWGGLDWTGCPRIYLYERVSSTQARIRHPFSYPPPPQASTLPAAHAFSHVLVGPRTLTTWVSCMQVRASSHTAVCHKQGSPVHDLHHAHRVQSIPCKTMPSASFAEPSSAWHITSLPTRPLGPDLSPHDKRTRGDSQGIHPSKL